MQLIISIIYLSQFIPSFNFLSTTIFDMKTIKINMF